MTILVFAGPTLPAGEATAQLPCTVLPPAGQGDIWRAVRRYRPAAIGVVDGVFRGTRAVWHREILWALSEGVHVLGAASMGALRAAELHPFGMVGVGRVFAAYRSGAWPGYDEPFEDDDEVAVEHAPPELGHVALSTAMVDLRDTLLAVEGADVIDRGTRLRLAAGLKATHYPRRSLSALEAAAGLPLAAYHTPRKRLDALELLQALAELDCGKPFEPQFRFQRTTTWDRFVAEAEGDLFAADDTAVNLALDELRLDPATWQAACLAGHGRVATEPDGAMDVERALSLFRVKRGLGRRADLERWMADNALDEAGLVRLLRTEPDRVPVAPPAHALAAELRATGHFARLHATAAAKARLPPRAASAVEADAALDWYFTTVSGGWPPSVEQFCAELGWRDPEQFRRAVFAAFRMSNRTGQPESCR